MFFFVKSHYNTLNAWYLHPLHYCTLYTKLPPLRNLVSLSLGVNLLGGRKDGRLAVELE